MQFVKSLRCPVRILSNTKKPTILSRRWNHTQEGLSYVHSIGKHPLVYRTIGQHLTHLVHQNADREALVSLEENTRLTYEQLRQQADQLAAGLQSLGLVRGDRVAIWAPQLMAWPVTMFAAARAGLVLVTLNPAYEAPELEFCLQSVGVRALVMAESFRSKPYYEKLLEIIPELSSNRSKKIQSKKLPLLQNIVMTSEKNYDGILRLSDVMSMPTASAVLQIEDQQVKISPDSGCNIQFTSGTTGKPKAALLGHSAYVNSALNIGKLELKEKKVCNQLPFFHISGSLGVILGVLSASGTVVIPSIAYSAEKALQAIQDEACKIITGTPAMYVDMINKQKELKLNIEADIAISVGASCPPQLFKEMVKELEVRKVKSGYGMTETSITFCTTPEDSEEQMYETVGCVQDHLEVKVVDRDGRTVPFGAAGELCIRGHSNMIEYWNNEEKTRETLGADGWLRTGDLFILHANGYGQIVGRLKEMIIRGGENIYPQEIENLLATCPQVAEVHIVGVPDERLGEEICAYIRPRAGFESATAKEIQDFCKGKIAHFKIPRYVELLKDFPRTQSGKVQKFKLQEKFLKKGTN